MSEPFPAALSRTRVVQDFLDFVQIDSPSRDEAALAAVLKERFALLGLELHDDHTGPTTGNLVGRLPATGPGQPILLTAHLDTVEPGRGVKPRLNRDVISSDGSTILGADCKVGLAAILEGLRVVVEARVEHPAIEVVLTWGEELGHLGARALEKAQFAARLGFCLDALSPVGTVVNHAPGYDRLRAVFRGRGAHAGVEPELGISAIQAAGQAIVGMKLGRIDHETTANLGLIHGGTARNAVPAEVVLEGEVRSRDAVKLAAQVARLRQCLVAGAAQVGATVEIEVEHEYLPYLVDPEAPIIKVAFAAAHRAGLAPALAATGGGSDANNFNADGIPMVVLGIGCTGAHTVDERVEIRSLELLARQVFALVEQAATLPTNPP